MRRWEASVHHVAASRGVLPGCTRANTLRVCDLMDAMPALDAEKACVRVYLAEHGLPGQLASAARDIVERTVTVLVDAR